MLPRGIAPCVLKRPSEASEDTGDAFSRTALGVLSRDTLACISGCNGSVGRELGRLGPGALLVPPGPSDLLAPALKRRVAVGEIGLAPPLVEVDIRAAFFR